MIRYRSIHCQHQSVVCPKKLTVFSTKYRTTRVRLFCGCWKIGLEKMCLKKLWTYTWHETGKWYIDNFFFVLFKNYKKLKSNDQTIIFFFITNRYSVVKPDHLWNAFDSALLELEQQGIHGETTHTIMDSWTNEFGYPVVNIKKKDKLLVLTQVNSVERPFFVFHTFFFSGTFFNWTFQRKWYYQMVHPIKLHNE